MFQIIVSILIFILFIVSLWCIFALRRLIQAIRLTNKILNETRELVASQEKRIKRLIKDS